MAKSMWQQTACFCRPMHSLHKTTDGSVDGESLGSRQEADVLLREQTATHLLAANAVSARLPLPLSPSQEWWLLLGCASEKEVMYSVFGLSPLRLPGERDLDLGLERCLHSMIFKL